MRCLDALGAMAKAHQEESSRWAIGHRDDEPGFHYVWRDGDAVARLQSEDEIRNIMHRMRADAAMRAAILALSEAELPEKADGGDAALRDLFRAMLREVAGDRILKEAK